MNSTIRSKMVEGGGKMYIISYCSMLQRGGCSSQNERYFSRKDNAAHKKRKNQ